MNEYEQGFIDKCAELGIDPVALLKSAQAYGGVPVPGVGKPPAVPAFKPKGPNVSSNQTASASQPVRPNPSGPRKITWDEVRRGMRNTPQDPSSANLRFEPQNFLKNVRGGFRRAFGI